MRNITAVGLTVTTHCNMSCPDCCCAITLTAAKDRKFHPMDYFVQAAKWLRGLDRIHLTGGEPTLSPVFPELVAAARELYGCRLLTLETNGLGFKRHPAALFDAFDDIYISHYTAASWEGSPDNSDAIALIHGKTSARLHIGEIRHIPRSTHGSKMCDRGRSELVAFSHGKFYPCCVGPGLRHAPPVTVEPSDNWKAEVAAAHPPCDGCFFAL